MERPASSCFWCGCNKANKAGGGPAGEEKFLDLLKCRTVRMAWHSAPMSRVGLRDSRFWAGLGPFKARFLLEWGMFTGTPFASAMGGVR